MGKYEQYVEKFNKEYKQPTVDEYIVGYSGLTPNAKVKPEEVNHEELAGLYGGDFAGHYHLTLEELEKFTGYESKIDTAESDITTLKGKASTAETDITSLKGKASTAETEITNIKTRTATAESEITSLKGRAETAETEISSLKGRADTAETDITSLKGKASTAETEISGLKTRTATAETAIMTLRTDTERGINEAKTEAQSAVTTLRAETETKVNEAKSEATQAVNTLRTDTEKDITDARLEAGGLVYALRTEAMSEISRARIDTQTATDNLHEWTEDELDQLSSELDYKHEELSGRISGFEGTQAEVKASQEELTARYDSVVGGLTEESEILDARVDEEGKTHPNLKHNIDNAYAKIKEAGNVSSERSAVIREHLQEQADELAGVVTGLVIREYEHENTLRENISAWQKRRKELSEHISEQLDDLSYGLTETGKGLIDETKSRKRGYERLSAKIEQLREDVDTNAYTSMSLAALIAKMSGTTPTATAYKNPLDWSKSETLAIPEPRCAVVNITGINAMPTSKTEDIAAVMEFWDMAGNYFRKDILCAAQGSTSMRFPKKNLKFDLMNEDGSEFEVKIGDWVLQDSFHLKSYYTDYFRGIGAVSYKFFDEIMRFNGTDKDRPYKKAFGVTEGITPKSGTKRGIEYQLDTGALCHPDGFPCLLYLNGDFYGIYSWQIKKHRKNYQMEKSNTGHIHLDGYTDYFLNGEINWASFEVRNPNKLYTMDGKKYDGDNPAELIDSTSGKYDPDNKDHKRTAQVKASIEGLVSGFQEVKRLCEIYRRSRTSENLSAARAEFEKYFDFENQRDYLIFSDVTFNEDGLSHNVQMTTYDGVKWYANAYDLDQTFGGSWLGTWLFPPGDQHITTHWNVPKANGPTYYLTLLYNTELEERYKQLRDAGIIETEHIVSLIKDWVSRIGADNYELEYEKWPESPCIVNYTDSIYRVKSWIETSIANMDRVYHYVSEAEISASKEAEAAERLNEEKELREHAISNTRKILSEHINYLQEQVNDLAYLKLSDVKKEYDLHRRLDQIEENIDDIVESGEISFTYEGAAVSRNSEVNDMMDDVFNGDGSGGEALSEIPEALKDKVTTSEEFDDMLDDVFG